jgi:hypothetical protein
VLAPVWMLVVMLVVVLGLMLMLVVLVVLVVVEVVMLVVEVVGIGPDMENGSSSWWMLSRAVVSNDEGNCEVAMVMEHKKKRNKCACID